MKPLLNLDEPVQRRNGEPAKIIHRDALGAFPVIALMTNRFGTAQFSQSFTLRGSVTTDDYENWADLINVPKPPKVHKGEFVIAITREGNRLQLAYIPTNWRDNFVAIKAFPYEITEGEGL